MKIILKLFTLITLCLNLNTFAFDVTSYNLGLADTFVPYARERLPVLVEEIKRHQTDLLCLQEVWRESDKQTIIESLKENYPYSYYTPTHNIYSNNSPTCNPWHLFGPNSVGMCVIKNCLIGGFSKLTQCVVESCRPELNALAQKHKECAQGLMAAVGKPPVKAFIKLINPFDKAPLFAYDGDNGVLVLSKHKIVSQSILDYSHFSTVNRRSSLVVDVEIENQKVTLACSHLAAQLSDVIPYPGAFGSWQEDNRLQINSLLEYFKTKTGVQILAGDFNCSLENKLMNIYPEFAENCAMITQQGFADKFYESVSSCTFCNSNRILMLDKKNEQEGGPQLDHIFSKGVLAKSATLEFNNPILIQLDGKGTMFHPSDHYGVRQSFEFISSDSQ